MADVLVYSSNLDLERGYYKSHAPGCRHNEGLDEHTHRLPVREMLPVLKAARQDTESVWDGSRWCSKCGGYALERFLTAEQCRHLDVAAQVMRADDDRERQALLDSLAERTT